MMQRLLEDGIHYDLKMELYTKCFIFQNILNEDCVKNVLKFKEDLLTV